MNIFWIYKSSWTELKNQAKKDSKQLQCWWAIGIFESELIQICIPNRAIADHDSNLSIQAKLPRAMKVPTSQDKQLNP